MSITQHLPFQLLNKYTSYYVRCFYPWYSSVPHWQLVLVSPYWWSVNKRFTFKGSTHTPNSNSYYPNLKLRLYHNECITFFGYDQQVSYD